MLNSKYQGSGHNLQSATRVIIFHKVSDTIKEQIVGRAQRYGRNKPLTVIQLLDENE